MGGTINCAHLEGNNSNNQDLEKLLSLLMAENNKPSTLLWMDRLRVFSTLSVILLHVVTNMVHSFGTISDNQWWLGNLLDSSVRFCVPIFLMISGALLLTRDNSDINQFLSKRVARILFPFLFWSLAYDFRTFWVMHAEQKPLSLEFVLEFILGSLKNGAAFHMWYIYVLVGLYLFFPIVGKWIRNSSNREIHYFLVIWIVTLFLNYPYLSTYLPDFNLRYFAGYIGYPVLGYYLMTRSFSNPIKYAWLFLLLGIFLTAIGTYFFSIQNKAFVHAFYEYLTPNVLLSSIGVFILFQYGTIRFGLWMDRLIAFVGNYSYGIYLVHIFVLWELGKYHLSYSFVHPLIGIPLTTIACLAVSTGVVWAINKLPLGKYISG